MYVANREEKVSFVTVEAATGEKIRMPYVSSVTGEEVPRADTLKRYVFPDGRQADVLADEVASVQPKKSRELKLEGFMNVAMVDPSLYKSTHQLGPVDGAETALSLLAGVMHSEDLMGYGTYVKGGSERLFCIRATGTQVFLHELYWHSEVREAEVVDHNREFDERSREMAKQLVMGLVTPSWQHHSYLNTHRDELLKMLDSKANGEAIELAPDVEPVTSPGDLMAMLEASIAAAKAA